MRHPTRLDSRLVVPLLLGAVAAIGRPATADDDDPSPEVVATTARVLEEPQPPLRPSGLVRVALSPDGRWVANADEDNIIQVWDAEAGLEVVKLHGNHGPPTNSVAISPDGKRIAAGGPAWAVPLLGGMSLGSVYVGALVQVWDVASGDEFRRFMPGEVPAAMAFSPDGQRLVLAGLDVSVWDVKTGKRLQPPEDPEEEVEEPGPFGRFRPRDIPKVEVSGFHDPRFVQTAFSADAGRVARILPDRRTIKLWDLAADRSRAFQEVVGIPCAIALSPDGEQFVVANHKHELSLRAFEGGEKIRDVPAPAPLLQEDGAFRETTFAPILLAISPDRGQIVSGTPAGIVRVWDSATGRLLQTAPGPPMPVRALAFLPDRLRVVSGGWDLLPGSRIDPVTVWEAERPGVDR